MTVTFRETCRICETELPRPFLDLGAQPLANNLPLSPDDILPRFPLELTRCPKCTLVQLTAVVDPHLLFDEYLYVPSTSQNFHDHFRDMAKHLTQKLSLTARDLCVDIGSNDGLLLSFLKNHDLQVVGVEPAKNLAVPAAQRGIPTYNEYFWRGTVDKIRERYGPAKLVTMTSVFPHVDGVRQVVKDVRHLLATEGTFVIEAFGLLEMLEKGHWDTIYHEHLSYFSVLPLITLFESEGMRLWRIEEVATHGGSLRVFASRDESHWCIDGTVGTRLERENQAGLEEQTVFERYRNRVEDTRNKLKHSLAIYGPVFGYGAPAKATVLANYCRLTPEHISFIVDDNTLKQGRYLPGCNIPIVSSNRLQEQHPETALIFPWNVADDLRKKLHGHATRAIVPMPTPHVVTVP